MAGSFLTKGTYSAGKHLLRRIAGEAKDLAFDWLNSVVGGYLIFPSGA